MSDVVATRKLSSFRSCLVALLGTPKPPLPERFVHFRTMTGYLAHGRELIQMRGALGAEQFVGKLDQYSKKMWRRGGSSWIPMFLKRFAYHCKVQYYACVEEVWSALIPILQRDHDLDECGARFLRFWNMQSPIPMPMGRTGSDLFFGQLLAFHSMSWVFMMDPAFCAIAGEYFSSGPTRRVKQKNPAQNAALWNLLGAILTAAHQYKNGLERQYVRPLLQGDVSQAITPAITIESELFVLDDYASIQGIRCQSCGNTLSCESYRAQPRDGVLASASFRCNRCRGQQTVRISFQALSKFMDDRLHE